jgi:hypothetical protein
MTVDLYARKNVLRHEVFLNTVNVFRLYLSAFLLIHGEIYINNLFIFRNLNFTYFVCFPE